MTRSGWFAMLAVVFFACSRGGGGGDPCAGASDGRACGSGLVCRGGACVEAATITFIRVVDVVTSPGATVALTTEVTVGSGTPSLDMDWSVDPASLGSVAPSRGLSTSYTAPNVPGVYKVWATSAFDGTTRGHGYVTVTLPPDSWRARAALPGADGSSVVAVAAGGKVYAIGSRGQSVQEYEPGADIWRARAPMPARPPQPFTWYAAAVAVGGKIYVLSPGPDTAHPVATFLDEFDPVTNTWTERSQLPTPRSYGTGLTAVDGKLYAIGGIDDPRNDLTNGLNVVEVYDLASSTWSTAPSLPAPYAPPPHDFAAAIGRKIYLLGFYGQHPMLPGLAFEYDVLTRSWSALGLQPFDPTWTSTSVANGKVYAFRAGDVVEYDPRADVWTARAPDPTPRGVWFRATSGTASLDGAIHVVGDAGGSPTTHEEYTPPLPPGPITLAVGTNPSGLLFDGSSMWVANSGGDTLTTIDPWGVVRGTFTVGPHPPGGLALTSGSYWGRDLWVTTQGDDAVARVDLAGAVVETFPVGPDPRGVAYDGAGVWVANRGGASVTRLPVDFGFSPATYEVAPYPTAIASDGASVYVVSLDAVTKLRVSDGTLLGSSADVNDPQAIAFDGSSLWVTNRGDDTVTKLRPGDLATLGSFAVGKEPVGVAADGEHVWIASSGSGTVTKLRASDGATLATFPVEGGPYGVAHDGTSVWVTSFDDGTITRW